MRELEATVRSPQSSDTVSSLLSTGSTPLVSSLNAPKSREPSFSMSDLIQRRVDRSFAALSPARSLTG
jgi:hypothetical protein